MMQEYLLDFEKTFSFFKENLSQVNALSNAVVEILKSKNGAFYAFLPENINLNEIHDFNVGGKTSCLREEISFKLSDIINSNSFLSCVFDDFNSDLNSVSKDDLYQSIGFHYGGEIYYQIHSGSNQEIVLKCLNYSSAIWHSLCVVFKGSLSANKEMTGYEFEIISKNAVFIMIEAYDSESYVYWCDSERAEILAKGGGRSRDQSTQD